MSTASMAIYPEIEASLRKDPTTALNRIQKTDQWEGSINRPNWPDALKDEAFHGLAGDITRTIEPHTESDPAAVLVQSLVGFGNLIGRRAHFKAEADRHFLNLYAVLVGVTSKARKGTSLSQVLNLLGAADGNWTRERIHKGLSTGEGLIWTVRDPIYKTEPIKDKGSVVNYQQVLEDPGIQDKRLLIKEAEFGRVLQASERRDNTLSAVLREFWDTGDMSTMTRSQAVQATHAHISLIGHITKDELLRLLTDTANANGFSNRFMWVCAKRSKMLPEGGELHKVDLSPLTRRLAAAADFARTVGEMKRDDGARALWRDIYAELSEGRSGLLGAVTSRAEPITMRLACLYALLDQSDVVRVEHLTAAFALWRYCHDSARFIFGEKLGDGTADEILRALRSTPEGMTRTDLNGHFNRNKKSDEINRALALLQEIGRVRMNKNPSGGPGRPTEVWLAV